jgi:hypothetical protein
VNLDASQIRFVTRGATPEEIAAVTAVLTAAAAEQAAEAEAACPSVTQDGWERSRRRLRSPVVPGPGAWRSFDG